MDAQTKPAAVEHLKGRKYAVKVDKKHRPAQIHRDVVVHSYVGEVRNDNANEFDMMYVRRDLASRLRNLYEGNGHADDMTFNQMLESLLSGHEHALRVAAGLSTTVASAFHADPDDPARAITDPTSRGQIHEVAEGLSSRRSAG